MDLIFEDGEKLYKSEITKADKKLKAIDYIESNFNFKLLDCQKSLIQQMFKENKYDYNVYGDDFKIEIIPNNKFNHECAISIKDYDENQEFENEIRIGFSKEELAQFINLLTIVKGKMI